jgi:hypothetical protein
VFRALIEGWRRALGAPGLAVAILVGMLLTSFPLAMTPGDLVGRDVLISLRATMTTVDAAWMTELGGRPSSLAGVTLRDLLGFGSTIAFPYILFWVFLAGGVLDRLARGRPVGTAQFFGACGGYAARFVRLGIIVAVAYWFLFRLFRPHVANHLQLAIFMATLAGVNLVADFAKVRAVVEDRRSVWSALLASIRFVWQRPFSAAALYLVNLAMLVGLAVLWQWGGVKAQGPSDPWPTLLAAVAYLQVRIFARLALMASEVAFFQGELAHAGYAAAPVISWPDSPAVEAIQNLAAQQEPRLDKRLADPGPEGSSW